jgi:hypothetical protein
MRERLTQSEMLARISTLSVSWKEPVPSAILTVPDLFWTARFPAFGTALANTVDTSGLRYRQ